MPDETGNQYSVECPAGTREWSATFNTRDRYDYEISDPPSMVIWHERDRHRPAMADITRSVYPTHDDVHVMVVWWERPGPDWHPMPYIPVCRPGMYDFGASGPYAVETLLHRTAPLSWPLPVPVDTIRTHLPEALEGAFRTVHAERGEGWQLIGYVTDPPRILRDIDEPGRYSCLGVIPADENVRPGEISLRRYGVNPEEPVIDEIDALVRDSLGSGPRDDYNVNRYDRCTQCRHQWHGLECAIHRCDCINTDWLNQGRGAETR